MKPLLLATLFCALPAFAQTTTITTDPSSPPTQVLVNPQTQDVPPPPPNTSVTEVETVPSGRGAVGTVAIDAIYGGVAGGVIGGGVTLIDQGNNWGRDLMVGAGVGILVGAAYGVFEVATAPKAPPRAVADRDPAASDSLGIAPAQYAFRF